MTVYRNERTLRNAYEAELAQTNIKPNTGECSATLEAENWSGFTPSGRGADGLSAILTWPTNTRMSRGRPTPGRKGGKATARKNK